MVGTSLLVSVLRSGPTSALLGDTTWYLLQFSPIVLAGVALLAAKPYRIRGSDQAVILFMSLFALAALATSLITLAPAATLPQSLLLAVMTAFLLLTYVRLVVQPRCGARRRDDALRRDHPGATGRGGSSGGRPGMALRSGLRPFQRHVFQCQLRRNDVRHWHRGWTIPPEGLKAPHTRAGPVGGPYGRIADVGLPRGSHCLGNRGSCIDGLPQREEDRRSPRCRRQHVSAVRDARRSAVPGPLGQVLFPR